MQTLHIHFDCFSVISKWAQAFKTDHKLSKQLEILLVLPRNEPVEIGDHSTGVRIADELVGVKEGLVTRVAVEKDEQISLLLAIDQAIQLLAGSSQTELIPAA